MNKIQDIINCYKKIPVYKLLNLNDNELQLLLNDKLLFYTKLIINMCNVELNHLPLTRDIAIYQEIGIEESFKKKTIKIIGMQTFPFDRILNNNDCIEHWDAKII